MGGIIEGCLEREREKVSTKGRLRNADAQAIQTDACAPFTFGPLTCRLISHIYKYAIYNLVRCHPKLQFLYIYLNALHNIHNIYNIYKSNIYNR